MRFIKLNNGETHYFAQPFTPDIESIAGALSHINRFNGHVGAYSVAQHSVLVSMRLPQELKLAGLLHDASEAYLGDITSPLKSLLQPQYGALEDMYHDIIDQHFQVDTRHPLVKEADLRMLVTEARAFDLGTAGFPDFEPYDQGIATMSPDMARDMFLTVYYSLTEDLLCNT